MLTITKIFERDMGHRLLNHASKCRNLHGHRYKVEITLLWQVQPHNWQSDEGMVVDFSDIKKVVWWWIDDTLDHWYMFQSSDPVWATCISLWLKVMEVDFAPTAENIVMWVFEQLDRQIIDQFWDKLTLHHIRLYETPTGFVEFGR